MHELGITKEILAIAIAKAQEENSKKVLQINLVIGDGSSVIDDCVQFYFDFESKETMAEGARLNFLRIPLQLKCRNCDSIFVPEKGSWECPKCGEWDSEIIKGNEFYMDSIEVE